MSKKLIDNIACILNTRDTYVQKRSNIRLLAKYKHKENRRLINAIANIISDYFLPINPNDRFAGKLSDALSNKNYEMLEEIKTKVNDCYFKAVCNELIWEHNHKVEFACEAIAQYKMQLEIPTNETEYTYTQTILSICRIYSKIKIAGFDFKDLLCRAIKYIEENYDRPGYCILFILNALSYCNEYLDIIEKCYEKAIDYYESQTMYDRVVVFWEGLEDFYARNKNVIKKNNAIKNIALNYEKQADQLDWDDEENSHKIISLIHKAMNSWDRTNCKDKYDQRKRLAKRLMPVKALSLKTFQKINTGKINIKEYIDHIDEFLSNASFELVLYKLSEIISLKSYEKLKDEFNSRGFLMAQLCTTTKVDNKGRVKCVIPSASGATNEEMISIMEYDASKKYEFEAYAFIQSFIWKIKEKFEFSKETLRFLVENNIFIEKDRQETFLNGLVAGFNLELSTAMHLLMPQVEHGLRCMAEQCGAVVYKTDKQGGEETLSLESILKLPEVVECLDETFLFNLRLFYTSDYGFGMRNSISHGLYSDSELQSAQSLAVWWFTFRICCMYSIQLERRIGQQLEKIDALN